MVIWVPIYHTIGSSALPCPALPSNPICPFPVLRYPALPCHAMPCSVLLCPALPRPALPCPDLPCPAADMIWQAVWTFVIPYFLASVIKGLLDRFGRVQMSAAMAADSSFVTRSSLVTCQTRHRSSEIRPYTSDSSCSSCQWRIQRGLLGHAPFGQQISFQQHKQ